MTAAHKEETKEIMMTKKLYSMFAVLSLFLMLAVTSVQAQSGGGLEANIPFDFQIGSKVLPAGEYTVRRLTQNSMVIESADGEQSVVAQTPGAVDANRKATQERLVFNKYGNQYFLSQVWMVRNADGRELIRSNAERNASKAQTLAQGGSKLEKIEIAVRVR